VDGDGFEKGRLAGAVSLAKKQILELRISSSRLVIAGTENG
jgi:hypothetical protein